MDKKKKQKKPAPIPHVEIRKSSGWPPPKELRRGGNWEVSDVCFRTIKDSLKSCGFNEETFERILDFGCETGRLMQYWQPSRQEVWGIDLNADAIKWNRENLPPELNFLVSPPHPHLPFVDGYFDFILAYSVFTHIGPEYLFWLLELRRVLSPQGVFYMTILDEHTMYKEDVKLRAISVPRDDLKEFFKEDFLIAHTRKLTFFKKENIIQELGKYFHILDYTPGVFNFQTGIVLTPRA
jgi:SAM-dependent methyltransferase